MCFFKLFYNKGGYCMLWSKFKNLKLGFKIIIGIIAIIFLPITLTLLVIELLIRSIKNRKVLGIIISGILTLVFLFSDVVYITGMYEGITTDSTDLALEQEQQEQEKEAEARAKAKQKQKEDAEKAAKEKEQQEKKETEKLPTKPIKYSSIDDLKNAYNSKLNDIMNKKQIQELDKDKITSNDVINIAKSSESLIRQASSDSQKIDLSGYLVSLDDLNHNTTDTVKNEIYEYLVSEYKSNKLKDKDNFYEYLYLTKYLYTSFSDVNNQKADTVFDMYQIVKDNYRNLDIESNINQVNKSLGIKSTSNKSTNKVKKHSSSYKKNSSSSNEYSNNNSSNSSIVYCNGGTSSSNKYHSSPNAHGMKGAIKMTEKQAKASGYVPCKKCY